MQPVSEVPAHTDPTSSGSRPDEQGKVNRMVHYSRDLTESLKNWVELRIDLARVQIEDEINARLRSALEFILVGVAVLFLLIALALGLGAWIGHPAWGFLAVGLGLVLGAGIIKLMRPYLVETPRNQQPKQQPKALPEGER